MDESHQPDAHQTPSAERVLAAMREPRYLALLLFAALIGVPLTVLAFGYLQAVEHLQHVLYATLPETLGLHGPPAWWPLPLLTIAGVLVALTVRYLPGHGGHEPAEGLHFGSVPVPAELPGVVLAAFASLSLGAVLGPEAPLVALGSGAASYAVRVLKRDADRQTIGIVGATGGFAAISTLFGSPLIAAFLLMEIAEVGGVALGAVLVPGLMAAGIGALVFIGLGSWTGLATAGLVFPALPTARQPDFAQFGWAIVIGIAAAVIGAVLLRCARHLQKPLARRRLLLTPLAGLTVAGAAAVYVVGTGKPESDVLFSGEHGISTLFAQHADYAVGALFALLVCKALAYTVSLAAFRGGPVFPAMYLGVAGGTLLSHLPGLPFTAAVAMGIGAMSVAILTLPLTSVLLATLLLGSSGLTVMPLVIVAVVVSRIVSVRISGRENAGAAVAA
ncbi:chloride channel protein [Actinospica durhamensis]|uniref:Chloride channel protein n=1 Tax=Actinospica durhamensis TaxID=1508375 RepID=A0A941ES36_9ACTN|nr:chloride channel protein [Actinospica durhamensis]MBR7836153.1 chloride channel protein [Actinospica durhamensis]